MVVQLGLKDRAFLSGNPRVQCCSYTCLASCKDQDTPLLSGRFYQYRLTPLESLCGCVPEGRRRSLAKASCHIVLSATCPCSGYSKHATTFSIPKYSDHSFTLLSEYKYVESEAGCPLYYFTAIHCNHSRSRGW